ncbi:porin family protein [Thermomonas fusca]|uniref:Porin family protein n=1 Tax=Thermomonas fusca TaxID=215690 RepID=A0A5R9PGR8_9GAMM|nr:porin family protein [Thermomonas fusca]TLX22675.1 porin family protein [Thermomonas fusca]
MKKSLMLACALVLAGLSGTASAGEAFVRGEIGKSDVKLKLDGVGSESDKDTAYALRGGYWFNSNFAVEGHYSRFYDQTLYNDGAGYVDGKLSAIGLGMVAKEHTTDSGLGFFVQLRAGVARGKISLDTSEGSGSETSTKPYYGIGAGYDFSRRFGLSLNYDHNQGSGGGLEITANTLSLGLEARF